MRVEQFYADQTLQKALDFDRKNAPNLQLAMILANDAKESENGPIRVLHRFLLTQTEN